MTSDLVACSHSDAVETATHQPESISEERTYPSGTIPALAALLDELAAHETRYCLWKSNRHLTAAMTGATDLDLLVDREQALVFRETLARHGLKRLVPPPDGAYPAMEHFLGLDRESGRLFHLHVHYQLVLGERYVKNYRLPIERQLLGSTRFLDGVQVPRAELELAILSARALLKYRARDVVKDALHIRSPGIPEEIQAEIAWLRGQTTLKQIRAALQAGGEVVPPDLICDFLRTMSEARRSGYALLCLRRRLRRSLRGMQRQRRLRASIMYFRSAWRRRRRVRRARLDTLLAPAEGGVTIALVGADGSGKSTTADAIVRWLSWKLEVRVQYMGSKAPSHRSRGLYLLFRALRRTHRTASDTFGPDSRIARPIAATRDVALALHYLSIGRDRARRYRHGRRDAHAGRVVIFDRFPLESLSSQREHRLLDGPQIAVVLGQSMRWHMRALAGAEEGMYQQFRLPDYLVVLDVNPDVAIARKPDHQPDALFTKSRAAVELTRLAKANSDVGVFRIDANRPQEAVLSDVRATVWDVL